MSRIEFSSVREFEELGDAIFPAQDSFGLLFLQGYPSARWLNSLGARFDIDPEFFVRHLDLSSDPTNSAALILPSYHDNMMSLPITTVGLRQCGGNLTRLNDQAKLDQLRREETKRMRDYVRKFRSLDRPDVVAGDPVFREYYVHGSDYFSLKQTLSLHFHRLRNGYGWIGKSRSPARLTAES